jgi:hypothetical protein
LKDEPASGLDCSGDFKAAPDIRQSGPAAGGGYVLRTGVKVKVRGNLKIKASIGTGGFRESYEAQKPRTMPGLSGIR